MRARIHEQIEKVIENIDWNVYIDDIYDNAEFSTYTPAGQDFNFCVKVYESDTLEDVADRIKEYANDFDVDYETYLWIGDDGHGKNGAPYHIKDIVNDMEKALGKVEELANIFME